MNKRRHHLAASLVVAALFVASPAFASPVLGSAQSFAVLGASTVTNTGSTTLWGDLGVYDGSSITGQETIAINGQPATTTGAVYVHDGDPASNPVGQQAQTDALAAYNSLAGRSVTQTLTGQNLGGMTLSPGVYFFQAEAELTGILTLDLSSDPDGEFVFQIGTALTTASGASVNVMSGNTLSELSGVYWLMGVIGGSGTGSATLGSSTVFAGNILALDSVTMVSTSKILCGRAIALNGAVTMNTNTISNDCGSYNGGTVRTDYGSGGFSGSGVRNGGTVPEPATLALVGLAIAGLGLTRRSHG